MAGAWPGVFALFWKWKSDSCYLTKFAWRSAKFTKKAALLIWFSTPYFTFGNGTRIDSVFRMSVVNARVIWGRPCLPSLTNIWKRRDRNENRCGIRHIATVLRRYQFSPSWQMFTALATGQTTETATEVAYFMESDQEYAAQRSMSDSPLIPAQAHKSNGAIATSAIGKERQWFTVT